MTELNDLHNMLTPNPKLASIKQVSSGWLNKYILEYKMPDGGIYEYEAISRKGPEAYRRELELNAGKSNRKENRPPDGICIVPMLPDGSVQLIREFRYAVNAWVVAFPAGLVEPGENILDCIERELREETGLRIRRDLGDDAIRLLPQTGYSSAGMTDENVRVAIVQAEKAGNSSDLQGEELIETFSLPQKKVRHFLDTNTDLIGVRCQLILEGMAS